MRIQTTNPARACDAAGLGNIDAVAAVDTRENTPSSPSAQAAQNPRAVLRANLDDARGLAHEAAGAAVIYARVIQAMAEVGDDQVLDIAVTRLREAAILAIEARHKIRGLRNGGAQ